MIHDGKCPGCDKTVTILDGPDTYHYDKSTWCFWHNECWEEHKQDEGTTNSSKST